MSLRDQLTERVTSGFRDAYGEEPAGIFAAPGRVNLIGEHTDYNQGLVLPCAIDRHTMVAIGPGEGARICAIALDLDGARDEFDAAGPIEAGNQEWSNHLRGVAHFLQKRGVALCGARIAIAGNIPQGAGLSSSASLGVSLGLALSSIAGHAAFAQDLARVAQAAENQFVGTQCGIMDQMASACSAKGGALLLDCRDLEFRHIPMPSDLSLVIIDSGVRHSLGDSPYNERRAQCEAAAKHYGASSLRDVSLDQLEGERGNLGDLEYARARHVVSEIERVRKFAQAMRVSDIAALSRLMSESFFSYRDDFEASVPEVDRLFDAVAALLGSSGGVRLTGGGFGGSLVALAPQEAVAELVSLVAPCEAGVFHASDGAHQIA